MCPLPQRKAAWSGWPATWIGQNLLKSLTKLVLTDVIGEGAKILAGQVRGRIVVKIL